MHALKLIVCTINSKINGTPKGIYLPISKLHFILAVSNLLAHNNIKISYYLQVRSFIKNWTLLSINNLTNNEVSEVKLLLAFKNDFCDTLYNWTSSIFFYLYH